MVAHQSARSPAAAGLQQMVCSGSTVSRRWPVALLVALPGWLPVVLALLLPMLQARPGLAAGGSDANGFVAAELNRAAVVGDTVATGADLDAMYAEFRPVLARELSARQIARPADLYKFLFQGVMGPAHAVVSEQMARDWLHREWQEIVDQEANFAASRAFPLCVPLRPDSQLVRIHLEPLADRVVADLPPAEHAARLEATWQGLATAFSRTANTWTGDPHLLAGLWERCQADRNLWEGRLDPVELDAFSREVRQAGWPAVHHSQEYRARWRPHYRVVARDQLPPAWYGPGGANQSGGPASSADEEPQG